jgi:hypothetical protein
MTPQVKGALIIGAAIIIGVAIWTYFSPYQSSIRAGYLPLGCVSR